MRLIGIKEIRTSKRISLFGCIRLNSDRALSLWAQRAKSFLKVEYNRNYLSLMMAESLTNNLSILSNAEKFTKPIFQNFISSCIHGKRLNDFIYSEQNLNKPPLSIVSRRCSIRTHTCYRQKLNLLQQISH